MFFVGTLGFQEVVLRELGSIKEEVQIIKTWVKRGEGAWSSPIQVPFSSEMDLNSAEAQLSSEATRSAFVRMILHRTTMWKDLNERNLYCF